MNFFIANTFDVGLFSPDLTEAIGGTIGDLGGGKVIKKIHTGISIE
jgi:hypothetical protein